MPLTNEGHFVIGTTVHDNKGYRFPWDALMLPGTRLAVHAMITPRTYREVMK